LVSTYDENALPRGASSCGALAYVHKEHLDADLIEQLWNERSGGLWRTA
jgi:two-component system, NarL family, invasion response regulator UvrY